MIVFKSSLCEALSITIVYELCYITKFALHRNSMWNSMQCKDKHVYNKCVAHLVVRFHQNLIVLAQSHQEHDGRHILKTVDPLPALWPLTPYINHPEREHAFILLICYWHYMHS